MKKELVDILVCPVCKGNLELNIETEEAGDIVTGSLYCSQCEVYYPVTESIPNLLPTEKD